MTEKEKRQRMTDSCPKQEADMQESCSPCDATDCDAEDDSCETCE